MSPDVSVIILNWNGLELLKRCLPTVAASTYDHLEIVVADNASTDDSRAWISDRYPHIRIIEHPDNWGFCRGNNEAIRQTSGDFVVLLNNDVEVEAGWIEPLVEEMVGDNRLAAVQPKLLDAHTRKRFEYAGASGGHMDRYGFTFARGRLFETTEEDLGQYDDPADIFWATGAAIMLRRDSLAESGLLDERFEFHMEEIDLCWRLRRLGFGIRVVPSSRVFHLGGSSLPRGSARKTYYNFRNSLLMLDKNLPRSGRARTMSLRVALDLLACLRFTFMLDLADARAVLSAYRDFLRLRTSTEREPGMTRHDVAPSYQGSIVFDYFLAGRRSFSSLPARKFRFGR